MLRRRNGGGGVVGRNVVLGPSYTRSLVCILFSYFLQISRETRDPRVNEEQMAHPVQRYVLGLAHVSLRIVIGRLVIISLLGLAYFSRCRWPKFIRT